MTDVLIIDDAATVRDYHRQILESAGFQVGEAFNGVEGLERLLDEPVQLVLVDVNMPQMDGLTMVTEMRQRPELSAVPVIVITTEENESDRRAAYAAGANGFMTKPTRPEALLARARIIIGEAAS